MPYIKQEIRSGKLLEVEVYYSTRHGKRGIHRSPNEAQTGESQEKGNERRAQKRLKRLITTNFSREAKDLFVTYTYGREVTEEEAMKGERNLLDRIRRLRKKKGLPELKYIVITEKQSKWHHHLIMNGGLTWDELVAVWGNRGERVHVSTLDDSQVCEGLARYLTEQHKAKKGTDDAENVKQPRRKGQHRWRASRNLQEPTVTKTVLKREPRLKEPSQRKGYQLIRDSVTMGFDVFGMVWSHAEYVRVEDMKRTIKGKAPGRRKKHV